jgi:16S rRNA (guanine966-N2)-methyltransferase
MRVIAGELGGRKLQTPAGGVRPTSDRVREALFQRLGDFADARVLDLYAGSGALGIEALSRGAARAVFVERSARAVAVVRANLAQLGIADRARVVHADAIAAIRSLARGSERFDLVFADPPYASDELARTFAVLGEAGIVVPGGMLVAETQQRVEVPDAPGFAELDRRRYGDSVLVRLVASGARDAQRGEQESE